MNVQIAINPENITQLNDACELHGHKVGASMVYESILMVEVELKPYSHNASLFYVGRSFEILLQRDKEVVKF